MEGRAPDHSRDSAHQWTGLVMGAKLTGPVVKAPVQVRQKVRVQGFAAPPRSER